MNNDGHVILIDDDPSVRKGLARLLSNAGYKVSQFTSLSDFLDIVKPGSSGSVILDSGILELSGKDLQAELKKHGIILPIIVISADDNSKVRQRAREMKAVGFCRKPIDGIALIDAIDWAIQAEKRKSHMFCPFYLSPEANGIGIWTNQPEAQCSIYGGRQC